MDKVFVIPFHVKRVAGSIMPEGVSAAYVSCFAGGNDYVEATEKALRQLLQDGMNPEEILQPILELGAEEWGNYILGKWPNYVGSLPSQIDFYKAINSGQVVYGPFGSYD